MQKIVLDTNCLIMAISARNEYNIIWRKFLAGDYVLCITNEIIEEYVEVISRNISVRLSEAIAYTILNRKNVERYDPHFRFNLIPTDPDDNKFVDCAIASSAKYIVTEDHHFDILESIDFPRVDVIGIDEFLKSI